MKNNDFVKTVAAICASSSGHEQWKKDHERRIEQLPNATPLQVKEKRVTA